MSDYASIVEKVRRSYAAVSRLEVELERDPSRAAIQINLASARRQAEKYEKSLLALSEERHIEICNYRLLPEVAPNFGLAHVAKSLLSYQYFFSQVHDAKANGPKQRATIGAAATAASAMEFAYSYSGSLGVALWVQNERNLLEGLLDASIEAFFEVMRINSAATAHQIIHELGAAVVKRAHDWSQANLEGGFGADIRWNRSDGHQLGEVIERRRFERLVEIIASSSDQKTENLTLQGVLIGGNIDTKSFHFVVPEGSSFRGYQAIDFVTDAPMTLGAGYVAVIRETKKYYYATERETIIHELVSLSSINPIVA